MKLLQTGADVLLWYVCTLFFCINRFAGVAAFVPCFPVITIFLNKQYITVDNSLRLLYTVCERGNNKYERSGSTGMDLIINNSSMQPIYEQIVGQIKEHIMKGRLQQETMLPSVRTLSKELRISALTVKKAYDALEQEGFIVTVHGKGSFVSGMNQNLLLEEQRKEVEAAFEAAVRKARSSGMTDQDLRELFEIIMEG